MAFTVSSLQHQYNLSRAIVMENVMYFDPEGKNPTIQEKVTKHRQRIKELKAEAMLLGIQLKD